MAGVMCTIVALATIPVLVTVTYDQAAVAAGDTRNYFFLRAGTALAQTAGLILGAEMAGLFGALIAQGLSQVLVYPLFVWLARRHGVWDPVHDGVVWFLGAILVMLSLWANWGSVLLLRELS